MIFAFDQTTRNTRKGRLTSLLLWRTAVLAILFASVGATRMAAQAVALDSTLADFSPNDYAWAVGIDSQGRIIVAGHASGLFEDDFALVRLNSDGSPDNSFGNSREVQNKVVSRRALRRQNQLLLRGSSSVPARNRVHSPARIQRAPVRHNLAFGSGVQRPLPRAAEIVVASCFSTTSNRSRFK